MPRLTGTCQLCEKAYPYREGKVRLCPACATDTIVREAKTVRKALYWAAGSHPATLSLKQWITTLDHFAWKCAFCLEGPYEVLEHFIPLILDDQNKSLYRLVGGTTAQNCVPACRWCNSRKGRVSPEYIWKSSHGVEQGRFPSLKTIERISLYLQVDLNTNEVSL